jgi:hypothetical protein
MRVGRSRFASSAASRSKVIFFVLLAPRRLGEAAAVFA